MGEKAKLKARAKKIAPKKDLFLLIALVSRSQSGSRAPRPAGL
jgi:hypothetical protein